MLHSVLELNPVVAYLQWQKMVQTQLPFLNSRPPSWFELLPGPRFTRKTNGRQKILEIKQQKGNFLRKENLLRELGVFTLLIKNNPGSPWV